MLQQFNISKLQYLLATYQSQTAYVMVLQYHDEWAQDQVIERFRKNYVSDNYDCCNQIYCCSSSTVIRHPFTTRALEIVEGQDLRSRKSRNFIIFLSA